MPVPAKWVILEPWVIRMKNSFRYIGDYRSGTHYDPEPPSQRPPKFFTSEASAKAFIVQWRRGIMTSDGDGYIHLRAKPNRKNVQFEIIQLQLVLVPD